MRLPFVPTVLLVAGLVVSWPGSARAQAVGIGPRLSFVRGDVPGGAGSTRFLGGIVRLRSSKRVVLELAADYRTEQSDDGRQRITERPLQGSLLLFPVRAALAPYVLGGYGVYARTTRWRDVGGLSNDEISERKTGVHLGFGAELSLGRRAALLLDYRYRFVRFGQPAPDETPVNLPGLSDRLSHRGSMWTSGVALYF